MGAEITAPTVAVVTRICSDPVNCRWSVTGNLTVLRTTARDFRSVGAWYPLICLQSIVSSGGGTSNRADASNPSFDTRVQDTPAYSRLKELAPGGALRSLSK